MGTSIGGKKGAIIYLPLLLINLIIIVYFLFGYNLITQIKLLLLNYYKIVKKYFIHDY